jgi:hypothetical protein
MTDSIAELGALIREASETEIALHAEIRRLREALEARESLFRLHFAACAECSADLVIDMDEPPHCVDCYVSEDNEETWLDAVEHEQARADAALKETK